jgi:hypothetical protein
VALLTLSAKAQGPAAWTASGTGPHTTCTTPVAGSYFLCVATDGVYVSNNGGSYFQIMPPSSAVAGVTSLSVNGGTPQTGAVAISIPTKFVGNSMTVTGSIQ